MSETTTAKPEDAAALALASLINPEALRAIIVEACRRGDVKVSIPGDVVKKLLGDQSEAAAKILAEKVGPMAEEIARKIARNVKITVGDRKPVIIANPHRQTEDLIALLKTLRPALRNVMMVGPAGSGKTTSAKQVAKSLGVRFHLQGQVLTNYTFDGFVDAHGSYRESEFRRFCANPDGGLFLQDEMDASEPSALLGLNSYTANGLYTFPDGKEFERTEKHYVLAACNTFGSGADRLYVGRNQLDAATTDRYRTLIWGYDEELEGGLAGNDSWHARVKAIRGAVFGLKLRHTVTPRDCMRGADEIAAGSTIADQEIAQLKRGMADADWAKVIANVKK